MMLEQLNPETMVELINFLLETIGPKVYDGITYALTIGDSKEDQRVIHTMDAIKNEIVTSGLTLKDYFQAYKVSNGYIWDLSMELTKALTHVIAKEIAKDATQEDQYIATVDLINEGPKKRRLSDIESLANYIVKQMQTANTTADKGKQKVVNIALFSRNSVPKITFTAKDGKGESVKVDINAYALRHTDLVDVNNLLLNQGYAIASINMGEILPSKTGVRVSLVIKSTK